MYRLQSVAALAVIAAGIGGGTSAQANMVVGNAVLIQQDVEGAFTNQDWTQTNKGDDVFEAEFIRTQVNSRANFALLDGSTIGLGATAIMKIDHVVFDPHNHSIQKLIVSAKDGAVRWISGISMSGAYQINTPHAVIRDEGTAFDLVVEPQRTLVLLHTGRVTVCAIGAPGHCKLLSRRGEMVLATTDDVVDPWESGLEPSGFESQCLNAKCAIAAFLSPTQPPSDGGRNGPGRLPEPRHAVVPSQPDTGKTVVPIGPPIREVVLPAPTDPPPTPPIVVGPPPPTTPVVRPPPPTTPVLVPPPPTTPVLVPPPPTTPVLVPPPPTTPVLVPPPPTTPVLVPPLPTTPVTPSQGGGDVVIVYPGTTTNGIPGSVEIGTPPKGQQVLGRPTDPYDAAGSSNPAPSGSSPSSPAGSKVRPTGPFSGTVVQPTDGVFGTIEQPGTTSGKRPAGPVVKGPPDKPPAGSVEGAIVQPGKAGSVEGVIVQPGKPPAGPVVEGSKGSPTGTNTDIVKGGGRSVLEGAVGNKANTTTHRIDKTSVSTTSTGNSGTKTGTSVSSIRGYTLKSTTARIGRIAPEIPHAKTEILKPDVHVDLHRTPAPKAPHPNIAGTVHLAPVHVPTTDVAPVHVSTPRINIHVPTPKINIRIPTPRIPIH